MTLYTLLLTMRMCVAELRAEPEVILRAAQKLGIPVYEYAEAKYFQLADLPRLSTELSGQQAAAADRLPVSQFANLMEVTCATVHQWIRTGRVRSTGERGNRMIAWSEMRKITDTGLAQGFIPLRLAAQILGITEQVLRARMKRIDMNWRWFHQTRTIHIEDLENLNSSQQALSLQRIESAATILCKHNSGANALLKGHRKAREMNLTTITRKAKTIGLVQMIDCVVVFTASPEAIREAAKKAGVTLLLGDDALFFRKIDLPALATALKKQPPSLPDWLSVNEFAVAAGVTPATVDSWIREKRVEATFARGVTRIAQGEMQKVIQQETPKGYVDLQTVARKLNISDQAVRARMRRRKIRRMRHGSKVLIAQRDVDRLVRFDESGLSLPDYACIKAAARSLSVSFAELRQAIATKKVQASIVKDKEGRAAYQLSPQQLEYARQYFYPDGAPLNQIAFHLGVSTATIKRMVSKGLLDTITNARQRLITRESYELFMAQKEGLTPREAADRLECSLREIDELVDAGCLRFIDPNVPVLHNKAILEQYLAEDHPRSIHLASEELGITENQVRYLINTQRLTSFKKNGQIRISVDAVRAFQRNHLVAAATIAETAQILGKEQPYIRTLLKMKKLKPNFLGNLQLVERASVVEYLKRCQEKAPLSEEQAAERLGCTVAEVKALVRSRKLRVTPKKRLITEQAVADYLADKASGRFYTVAEAAKVLNIPIQRVYRLIEQRKIQAASDGSRYQVLRASVLQYRAEQEN